MKDDVTLLSATLITPAPGDKAPLPLTWGRLAWVRLLSLSSIFPCMWRYQAGTGGAYRRINNLRYEIINRGPFPRLAQKMLIRNYNRKTVLCKERGRNGNCCCVF